MADETPSTKQVPVVWVDQTDGRAQWVNQILSTFQPDEFVVTLGQLVPPPITGDTEEERRDALSNISFVPINTVARVVMTRQRIVEFIDVLQRNLAQHDEALKNRPEQ
jgi:hypothetical protein